MSYTVKPETYTRCSIECGLNALAQARPEWLEALEAVAVLFNVDVTAPQQPTPGTVIRLEAMPRRRVTLRGRG